MLAILSLVDKLPSLSLDLILNLAQEIAKKKKVTKIKKQRRMFAISLQTLTFCKKVEMTVFAQKRCNYVL